VSQTVGSIQEDATDLTYNRRAYEELSDIVRQRHRLAEKQVLFVLQWPSGA